MKKNNYKVSGNPQKRANEMKETLALVLVNKEFEKVCNASTGGARFLKNRGDFWTFSEEFDVNVALDFLNKIDPSIVAQFKVGELTTAEQLKECRKQMKGDALSNNFFEVRLADKKAFRGKWWGMNGSEFRKVHKDIPISFTDNDLIICDVSYLP